MIIDGDVLTAGFQSEDILHLEAETKTLANLQKPITEYRPVNGTFNHGPRKARK